MSERVQQIKENLQISRVGARGRKRRASLHPLALRSGPQFCRYLWKLWSISLGFSVSSNNLSPGDSSKMCHLRGLRVVLAGFERAVTFSKRICSFGSWPFHLTAFFLQRFTVCKAVSLPPEKLILSLKTHKMHEFPARNIEIIVPPGHPISKPVIPRGPKSGGAQAPST